MMLPLVDCSSGCQKERWIRVHKTSGSRRPQEISALIDVTVYSGDIFVGQDAVTQREDESMMKVKSRAHSSNDYWRRGCKAIQMKRYDYLERIYRQQTTFTQCFRT